MGLYLHHRRKLIGLHWVAVSTAGAGTIVAACNALAPLVWPPSMASTLIDSHIALILLGFLLLICLAAIVGIQHVILQQVGLSNSWITSTIVGLAFGVFACILCAVVAVGLAFFRIRHPALFASGLVFSFGAGMGFVQCREFATSWPKRRVWILLNGFFPLLAVALLLARIITTHRPLEFGLCVGLLYGVMTGPCLAWMAPSAAEAERLYQQRIAKDLESEFAS